MSTDWYLIHLPPSPPSSLPIEGMKRKIMRNLRSLEEEGMVNSKNDYQEIINAIAKVKHAGFPTNTLKVWYIVEF